MRQTIVLRDAQTVDLIKDLKTVLHYEPSTGLFTWKKKVAMKTVVGAVAGYQGPNGYVTIKVWHARYLAHRLAWLLEVGAIGDGQIDHINGIRNDNRLSNLRLVSAAVNRQNLRTALRRSKTGLLGVTCDRYNRYGARITVAGVTRMLGFFSTPEEAHQAYLAAKLELHEGCTI